MTEHNFWFWILEAVSRNVLGWVARVPAHEYWGLANMITGYTVELTSIMFRFMGLFISLADLGRLISAVLILEAFLWIKRLAVDNIFTIIKFFL